VLVSCEGSPDVPGRVAAAKLAAGLSITEPCGFYNWTEPVALMNPASVTAFIRAVKPLQPRIVVIDNWAQSLAVTDGDDNSSRDVGVAVGQADRIRRELGCTVLIIHHDNKNGSSERGSGALRGACDTMLLLTQADDLLQLSVTKQRSGPKMQPIDLRLVPIYEGADACVVRLASDVLPTRELTDTQAKVLHAMRELFASTGATGAEWEAAVPDVSRRSFYRARQVLLDRGVIHQDGKTFRLSSKVGVPSSATRCANPINRECHEVSA
jgi:hypothetical protein